MSTCRTAASEQPRSFAACFTETVLFDPIFPPDCGIISRCFCAFYNSSSPKIAMKCYIPPFRLPWPTNLQTLAEMLNDRAIPDRAILGQLLRERNGSERDEWSLKRFRVEAALIAHFGIHKKCIATVGFGWEAALANSFVPGDENRQWEADFRGLGGRRRFLRTENDPD